MNAARLDLTSFLDVLTIVLLALLVAQRDAGVAAAASEAPDIEAAERLAVALDANIDLARRLEETQRELDEALQELRLARADARLAQPLQALSEAERGATGQLLAQALTVVYFELRGDAVVSYRKLGETSGRAPLTPLTLTQLVAAGDVPAGLQYTGQFFDRLALAIDNSMVQRTPADRVFYVFIDADGSTSCAAMIGLRRELAARPDLVAMLPPTRCE